MTVEPTRGPGRPSSFTPKTAERILERIADGESLRAICRDDDMPDRSTVLKWLWGDNEQANAFDFATKYARAREAQGDVMDDRILEVADGSTSESAAADRVKILAYQWRAAKLRPKVYGDKITQEHTGANGAALVPVINVSLSKP